MRDQREREEQTVLIGTALGVFAAVMVVGALVLWMVHSVFEVHVGSAAVGWAFLVAGVVAVVTLLRSERG